MSIVLSICLSIRNRNLQSIVNRLPCKSTDAEKTRGHSGQVFWLVILWCSFAIFPTSSPLPSWCHPQFCCRDRASRDPALRAWQCWWRVVEPTEAACRAAQLSSAPAASSSNFSSYRRCRHQLRSSPASSKEQHLRNASSQAFGKYQWIEHRQIDGRTAKVHLPILDLCSSTLTSV